MFQVATSVNTQADDTLPFVGVMGGMNCWITPGPHTQPFGGAPQKGGGFGSMKGCPPPPSGGGTPTLQPPKAVEHPSGSGPGQEQPPWRRVIPRPSTPSPALQTKVTIVGKNEIYNREKLLAFFGLRSPLLPLSTALCRI